MLEDRLTPAALTFYWKGVDSNFNSATNWWTVIPEAGHAIPRDYDAIVFGVAPPATGGGTDGDPPTSPPASNASCIIPEAHTFAGIHLQNVYSGTVTVQDETFAGYLEIRTGAIAQIAGTDASADLIVTVGFDFTGGILNNTSTLGVLHLINGAVGYMSTASDASITTGSTIAVGDSGSAVSMLRLQGGNFHFANDALLFIAENGEGKSENEENISDGNKVVRGKDTVETKTTYITYTVDGVNALVSIKAEFVLTQANTWALYITKGSVTIDTVALRFAANSSLRFTGGKLFTEVNTTTSTTTIFGKLFQEGGELELGANDASIGYLHVTGKVFLKGGKMVRADLKTTTGESDMIVTEATMQFGSYSYEVETENVPANSTYKPFRASNGFVKNNDNTVTTPTAAGYTVGTLNDNGQLPAISIRKNN